MPGLRIRTASRFKFILDTKNECDRLDFVLNIIKAMMVHSRKHCSFREGVPRLKAFPGSHCF